MLLRATDGLRGTVWDLDTGRRVPKVVELNLERGYVKAWWVVKQDDEHPEREKVLRNELGEPQWYEAQGRFKFVPAATQTLSPRIALGAPKCVRCTSPLTLPGEELCPRCLASDRGQRNRFLVEKLTTPLFDRKCQECSRLAAWSVADEVGVSPEKANRWLWDRGMTVGRRFYCDLHYQPARLLDPKGEVIQDLTYAGPDVLRSTG